MEPPREYVTELYRLVSPLFLYLASFRRKVRKGYQVDAVTALHDLEELFATMERESRTDPRMDALYEKANYPLVVLADEVLMHSDWEHGDSWTPLEERYFQTNVGGDRLFQIASELRYDEVELAALLYTAICLGVKGTFHLQPEKLTEVKNKLYRQMSEYLAEVQHQLTPDAYHVNERAPQKLSTVVTLGRVAIVTVGLIFIYWLATRFAWIQVVSDLRALVNSLTG